MKVDRGIYMKFLEEAILTNGRIIDNEIIKVDSFINHQIDPKIINKLAEAFVEEFKDQKIDKVLTLETSGIPIAYAVASLLGVKMVFAKKSKSKTVDMNNVYSEEVRSFTRGTVSTVTVSKNYIVKGENILLVDDFLAKGNAALGLINIVNKGGAHPVGFCAAITKSFQGGRDMLEAMGIKVVSGATITAFKDNKPIFE